VDSMIPSGRELFARQEFELSDLLQATAKVSDLSVYLSTMPTFFWIFVIVLVYNIVNIAAALMQIWVDAVIFHLGIIAYACLLVVVWRTWPMFIWYLRETFRHAREVMAFHSRIVQFHGVPSSLCSVEAMAAFCNARQLAFSSVIVPPPPDDAASWSGSAAAGAGGGGGSASITAGEAPRVVEVVFPSVADLQHAFNKEVLTPHLKMNGVWVRVRPKIGTNAALVEWWLVCFEYMNEAVPERYWIRATVSCLISMSLTKHLAGLVVVAYNTVEEALGVLGLLMTKIGMLLSLISLFFFVGHHAYEEILDAYQEMMRDTRPDRIPGEPKLGREGGGRRAQSL